MPTPLRTQTRALSAGATAAQAAQSVEKLRVLTEEGAERVRSEFGTPSFVYSAAALRANAAAALSFPSAFGLTARYAMKASPNASVVSLLTKAGMHVDASSGHECRRAIDAGVPASNISLSTQELPDFFAELVEAGVKINACSLSQLSALGRRFPGMEVGLRVNPGVGSGGTGKTNVGGPESSFGIWHELLGGAEAIVKEHSLRVVRIHTHIGSGSDPKIWQSVSAMSLDLCRRFSGVTTLNLGGGYKVGRMSTEPSTDLQVVGVPVQEAFEAFAKETGRELHLEIEPGTFMLANAGCLVATVQDVVTTGSEGHSFLKLDSGMTEICRPSLYGAQHPIVIVKSDKAAPASEASYIVVGHCCESGDLLTTAPGEPETLLERRMTAAEAGDIAVIEGSGAYCSSMSTKNYNSFPEAAEVLVGSTGDMHLIRQRQPLEQIWQNEVRVNLEEVQ